MNYTTRGFEFPHGSKYSIDKSEIIIGKKFWISINEEKVEYRRYSILTSSELYIADSVTLTEDSIKMNIVMVVQPKWYYLSYETSRDASVNPDTNTIVLKGKCTKIEFKAENWTQISKFKKYLRYQTVQKNFNSEFEITKKVKRKYTEEAFIARRLEDGIVFFCRKFYIHHPDRKKKLDDFMRILKINDKLKSEEGISHFEWLYEEEDSLIGVHKYFELPLVKESVNRYSDNDICTLVIQLSGLVTKLDKHNLLLIKFEPGDFRLKHSDCPLENNEIFLTNLNYIIEKSTLHDVKTRFKSKLHIAPELQITSSGPIDSLAASVFGIGQLLYQLLLPINLKLLKLRNIQEVNYMNSFNFKKLYTIGLTKNSKIISY